MTQTSHDVAWLTQDAYDKLKAELEQLTGPGRIENAKRIEAARAEGDLSENGGYHAAKDEQGHQEARIRQLQDLLQRARVGETPPDDGVVEQGMVVTIRFEGDEETETFLLGARELASFGSTDLTVYSPKSPLGKAIMGAKVGDSVSYAAPNGRDLRLKVVQAKPFTG